MPLGPPALWQMGALGVLAEGVMAELCWEGRPGEALCSDSLVSGPFSHHSGRASG